jgi:hypothetical protein
MVNECASHFSTSISRGCFSSSLIFVQTRGLYSILLYVNSDLWHWTIGGLHFIGAINHEQSIWFTKDSKLAVTTKAIWFLKK